MSGPAPIGGWTLKAILRLHWQRWIEKLLPKEPEPPNEVTWDWKGRCKLCGRPQHDTTLL